MKSKRQKQEEAMQRKWAEIPRSIEKLRESLRLAMQMPEDDELIAIAKADEKALAQKYQEVGLSREAAEGCARAAALGQSPTSWMSGVKTGVEYAVESAVDRKEPATVEDAVERTRKLVRDVRAVCLIPHPFRRAVQIRADGPYGDGSLIANMEILELDRLGRAFQNAGVQVFRQEAEYVAYQAGEGAGAAAAPQGA